MPRPKKELETPADKKEAEVLLRVAMKGSQKFQKSRKRYVEKLIPIQPIQVMVKEENGERYEFVPCEKIQVEI